MSGVQLGPNHPDYDATTDARLAGSCPGRWCRCLSCALARQAKGMSPLPIVIGRHVIPSLPTKVMP